MKRGVNGKLLILILHEHSINSFIVALMYIGMPICYITIS
jgi:hypothetical protein